MNTLLQSLVPEELTGLVTGHGFPAYRTRQLLDWIFTHRCLGWQEMSNVPVRLRECLATDHDLDGLQLLERQVSADGTRKFLFGLRDGAAVESVMIPMTRHPTFCISCQVGCGMACRFCATARGGLVRNLEPGEIVQQVLRLQDDLLREPIPGFGQRQPNVVYMGMGEPLDNWPALARSLQILQDERTLGISRRRIQISTSGPREGLLQLLASPVAVGLTLSLGGSTDAERRRVMPVPGRTSVAEAIDLCEQYARRTGRRATVAWVLIEGRTDEPDQARRLGSLLAGRPFKVNLIPLNPLDADPLAAPGFAAILAFQKVLTDAGVDAFIRASGGQDIAAACGQLRRRRLQS